MEPECSLPQSQVLSLAASQHDTFLRRGVVSPTPKLEDYTLSAVRDCLFSIFISTLHIGGRSSTRKLRKCHAVVTGAQSSRQVKQYNKYLYSQRFDSTTSSYWISVIFILHYFGFLQSLVFVLFQEITETKRTSRLMITQNEQNLTKRRHSLSPKRFHKIRYWAILIDFFKPFQFSLKSNKVEKQFTWRLSHAFLFICVTHT
jgi:hypothetical protein